MNLNDFDKWVEENVVFMHEYSPELFKPYIISKLREFGGRIKEFAAKGHLQDGDVVATLNTQIDKELEELE